MVKDEKERDVSTFLILPFLLWRMLHNQIWITLSRYRTAKGNGRILDKGLEFEQVDREREWLVFLFYFFLLFIEKYFTCSNFLQEYLKKFKTNRIMLLK